MSARITTERLVLRPLEKADLARLVTLVNSWNVARMLSRVPFPYDDADGERFLVFLAANPQEQTFAINDAAGLVGCIGLHPDDAGGIELGYWLGEPYWGRGYATEAGHALIRYGFETLRPDILTSGHFVENLASSRVLQKLGFRYTGDSERDCVLDRPVDGDRQGLEVVVVSGGKAGHSSSC